VLAGQGPYFGQATWFARFHPEKVQSAIDRYVAEIIRVTSVLDTGLARNGTGWLVGDKCTYADLSFVTWALVGEGLLRELGKLEQLDEFSQYHAWMKRLSEMPEVSKIREQMAQGRREHGLP